MKILLLLSAGKLMRDAVLSGKPHKYYAPTTLSLLAALVPQELNATVEMVDQGVERLPDNLDADLLAISAITSAAPEAYRIADRARQKGIKVVIGGYHASFLREEALLHADSVVAGFAEKTWPELLRDFARNKLKRLYEDCSPDTSLDIPPLNRDLLDKRKYFVTNTIEATRGCPNRCGFCVIHRLTGNRYMHRPVRRVVEEIETMGKEIIFFDPSPFEFRDYFKSLLEELVPLHIRWYGACTMRLATDDDLFKLAVRSGCKGFFIGFESVDQDSLNGTGKEVNKTDLYKPFIDKLHDNGISILGSFALGLENDDISIFDKTVDFVIKSKIDIIKLGMVTPLPGSAFFNSLKKQNRILTEDWERYDTDHCVFRPLRMSSEELEEGYNRAYRQIYKYSSIFKRIIRNKADYLHMLPANIVLRKFRRETA